MIYSREKSECFEAQQTPCVVDLRNLLSELPASDEFYRNDLLKSCEALEMQGNTTNSLSSIPYNDNELEQSRNELEKYSRTVLANIREALTPQRSLEYMADLAGLWPRLTPRSLLGLLSVYADAPLPKSWKEILIGYGKSLVNLHRAHRLIALARCNEFLDFFQELRNTGFEGWNPLDYPDWLLIQVRKPI
jgi:hypothetical protein